MRLKISIISIIISLFVQSAIPVEAQSVASDLLGRINALRGSLDLPSYQLNTALTAAAQQHANWMVATSQVSHIQDDGSRPADRAQANGYASAWVSENIYMGLSADVDAAWTFWVNSGIHYAGLTSRNYRDIGIASATGAGGQAFVLVFGVPGGTISTANTAGTNTSGGDGDAAEASIPLPIVGYDEVGNIQFELQAGQTLGDVLLIFGYTWDDLNAVMVLNGFVDADIRSLDVGQVILIPPPQGTFTPTPMVEVTEDVSADVAQTTLTPTPQVTTQRTTEASNTGIIPTPDDSQVVPTDNAPTEEQSAEVSATPEAQLLEPVTFVAGASTETPTPSQTTVPATQTPIPTMIVSTSVAVVSTPVITVSEPIISDPNTPSQGNGNNPPWWLVIAIVLQIGILGFASFEYFRRLRR